MQYTQRVAKQFRGSCVVQGTECLGVAGGRSGQPGSELLGIGEHSYRIDGQWLHRDHGFAISAASATAQGPLYRFPFYSLAFVTLAANVAGMAAHFMQLARPAISRRKHSMSGLPLLEAPGVAALLDAKEQSFAAARGHFYQVLERGWAQVVAEPLSAGAGLGGCALAPALIL
eukprot:gene36717-45293_t